MVSARSRRVGLTLGSGAIRERTGSLPVCASRCPPIVRPRSRGSLPRLPPRCCGARSLRRRGRLLLIRRSARIARRHASEGHCEIERPVRIAGSAGRVLAHGHELAPRLRAMLIGVGQDLVLERSPRPPHSASTSCRCRARSPAPRCRYRSCKPPAQGPRWRLQKPPCAQALAWSLPWPRWLWPPWFQKSGLSACGIGPRS